MIAAVPCPNIRCLHDYLQGDLSASDSAELEGHISGCDHCAESINSLAGCDALTDAIRDHAAAGVSPVDDTVSALIERLRRNPPGFVVPGRSHADTVDGVSERVGLASAVQATQEAFNFLAPPEAEGELGRLGPYRVLKLLGAGGMGIVLLAEDPHLRRTVALKVMRPSLALSRSARERFLREARAIAALEHDHIVTVLQAGEDRGVLYLAMPLLKGESLADRLAREGRLPVKEALRIAREVADGLDAAHQRGLVHRDIKPANIWLEAGRGRAKILDFGLARAIDAGPDQTHIGTIAGTPQFMSPEQARGEVVTPRSDLFSLGGVLYQMVTGRPPFEGPTAVSVLLAVALKPPPSPLTLNPDLPLDLSRLISRLLSQAASERPDSARAVVEAIETIERFQTNAASPGAGRNRRWRTLAQVGGLLVLLVTGGVGIAFAPVVYRLATDKGELVIVTDDPHVEVVVKEEGRVVTIIDTETQRRVDLHAGSYTLDLSNGIGGLHLSTDKFTLRRGGREIVRVYSEPRAPVDLHALAPRPAPIRSVDRSALDRTIANLTEHLQTHRDDAAAYQARAAAYNQVGDADREIADLSRAIALEPSATRHEFRAGCYFNKRDFDRAEADYETALRLDPKAVNARVSLGVIAVARQDYDRAQIHYDVAVQLDPTSANVRLARGDFFYQSRRDYDRALADCREAIRLDGLSPQFMPKSKALTLRGSVYWRQGEIEKALADLDEAVRLDPDLACNYDVRAGIHAVRNEPQAQLADLNRAVQLEPQNPYVLAHRCTAYFDRGDYALAVADADASIRLLPDFPWAYQFRGQAHAARGETKLAIADFSEAIRLDPRMVNSFGDRAELYEKQGEHEKANADRESVKRLQREGVK